LDSNGVVTSAIQEDLLRSLSPNSYTAATGEFEIKDLSAGNYSVTADASAGGSMLLTGSLRVAIPNANVDNVNIAVNPLVTVTGRSANRRYAAGAH
jgi:hypothetical protein